MSSWRNVLGTALLAVLTVAVMAYGNRGVWLNTVPPDDLVGPGPTRGELPTTLPTPTTETQLMRYCDAGNLVYVASAGRRTGVALAVVPHHAGCR